jgi:hypothetical protein
MEQNENLFYFLRATNNHFPLLQRLSDWMGICEDLVDLLQRPSFRFDKSKVYGNNSQGINCEVENVKFPSRVCDADWCSIGIDEADDI